MRGTLLIRTPQSSESSGSPSWEPVRIETSCPIRTSAGHSNERWVSPPPITGGYAQCIIAMRIQEIVSNARKPHKEFLDGPQVVKRIVRVALFSSTAQDLDRYAAPKGLEDVFVGRIVAHKHRNG